MSEHLDAYKMGAAAITPSSIASVEFHRVCTSIGMVNVVLATFFSL
jgi:hypothetical protein